MTRKVGSRVGAMLNAGDKLVRMLGYGVYEGEEVPPEDLASPFRTTWPNPKIKLDSGKIVWGCECWWGPEESMKAKVEAWRKAGYTIEDVDIDAARDAVAQKGE